MGRSLNLLLVQQDEFVSTVCRKKKSDRIFSHSFRLLVYVLSHLSKLDVMLMPGAHYGLGFNVNFAQIDEWCAHLTFYFSCC